MESKRKKTKSNSPLKKSAGVKSTKKTVKKTNKKTTKKPVQKAPTATTLQKKRSVSLMDTSHLQPKPFGHQIEAAKFLLEKKRAILAFEMGSGKTFSAILAMSSLKGKKLIVCPSSLKLNWQKEIRWVSKDPVVVLQSHHKWKKFEKNAWVIINYDLLPKHLEEIKKENFQGVVFDEAHFAKSINNNGYGGSKRARAFISIANTIEYVFLLSGTPITNKTKDVFNLLKAIKHPLSHSFKNFAKRYCAPEFNGFGYTYDGSSNREELNEKLMPYMLRKKKEEMLDLPEKVRSFFPVEINKAVYTQKVTEYMANRPTLGGKNEHLVYLNVLRHTLSKEKIQHTTELVKNALSQEEPVVVFTSYKVVVEALKETFPEAVTITGGQSTKERQKAVEDFQSGKSSLIICNLIAGGVGLTLTRARTMFIHDFDWLPANLIQAEDRIHRMGQTKKATIHYVYAEGTIDEKMAGLLQEKLLNINKIIDDEDMGFLDQVILFFDKTKEKASVL